MEKKTPYLMMLKLHGVLNECTSEDRDNMIANANKIQIESPDKIYKFIYAHEKLCDDMIRARVPEIEDENTTVKYMINCIAQYTQHENLSSLLTLIKHTTVKDIKRKLRTHFENRAMYNRASNYGIYIHAGAYPGHTNTHMASYSGGWPKLSNLLCWHHARINNRRVPTHTFANCFSRERALDAARKLREILGHQRNCEDSSRDTDTSRGARTHPPRNKRAAAAAAESEWNDEQEDEGEERENHSDQPEGKFILDSAANSNHLTYPARGTARKRKLRTRKANSERPACTNADTEPIPTLPHQLATTAVVAPTFEDNLISVDDLYSQ